VAFDFAVGRMHKFVMNTDSMPTNSMRHLPSCLTKSAVYEICKEEMKGKTDFSWQNQHFCTTRGKSNFQMS